MSLLKRLAFYLMVKIHDLKCTSSVFQNAEFMTKLNDVLKSNLKAPDRASQMIIKSLMKIEKLQSLTNAE